ncbi:MAG: autotransporter domain-containing protein [Candidatus Omnitrophica bacterium]|nr:autotransporter domain-containing protein [Candidatus Omnitrophota bacterium]
MRKAINRTGRIDLVRLAVIAAAMLLCHGLEGRADTGTVRDNIVTNTLAANDDGFTSPQAIGFSLNYLGHSNSLLYVVNNGNIQFNAAPPANFDDTGLTTVNSRQILAPYFGDVDTLGAGSALVQYGTATVNSRPAYIVNWPGVGYYQAASLGFDKLNNFQLVLIDRSDIAAGDFDIEFNYKSIQWGAVESGSAVRAGFTDGTLAAGTQYLITGSAVSGAFLDSNTSTGLIYASNIGMPGRFLFLARNGMMITAPVMLTAVAVTPSEAAIAQVLDKWQGTVTGDFANATNQINAMSSTGDKRNALARLGVSFLGSFVQAGFDLARQVNDQIARHLFMLRAAQDGAVSHGRLLGESLSLAGFAYDDAPFEGTGSLKQALDQAARLAAAQGLGEQRVALTDTMSWFAAASRDTGEFKGTEDQIGHRFRGYGISNGLDWRVTDRALLGAAFGYGGRDAHFDDERGDMDARANTWMLYGSTRIFNGGYMDASAGYSGMNYDHQRRVNAGTIDQWFKASPKGHQASYQWRGGYDIKAGKVTWGPLVEMQYMDAFIESFRESGPGNLAAKVEAQRAHSLTAAAGGRVATQMDMRWGMLFADASVLFERELKNDGRSVRASFADVPDTAYETYVDAPDRHDARVGFGFGGVVYHGMAISVDCDMLTANKQLSARAITATVRVPF